MNEKGLLLARVEFKAGLRVVRVHKAETAMHESRKRKEQQEASATVSNLFQHLAVDESSL